MDERVERFAWRAREQPEEPVGVFPHQPPQVRRMIGETEKDIARSASLEFGSEPGRRRGTRAIPPGCAALGLAWKAAAPREDFRERRGHSGPSRRWPAREAAGRPPPARSGAREGPGRLSSSSTAPPCIRATAAASESPSPEPGREREPSSLTNRSSTRARSAGSIPGPRSATVKTTDPPIRCPAMTTSGFVAGRPRLPPARHI